MKNKTKTKAAEKIKLDCYECKYKGDVPGSCHSSCNHPKCKILNEKGNHHGIEKGWFNHPMNFDPVWLEDPVIKIKCNGFERKKEVKNGN